MERGSNSHWRKIARTSTPQSPRPLIRRYPSYLASLSQSGPCLGLEPDARASGSDLGRLRSPIGSRKRGFNLYLSRSRVRPAIAAGAWSGIAKTRPTLISQSTWCPRPQRSLFDRKRVSLEPEDVHHLRCPPSALSTQFPSSVAGPEMAWHPVHTCWVARAAQRACLAPREEAVFELFIF